MQIIICKLYRMQKKKDPRKAAGGSSREGVVNMQIQTSSENGVLPAVMTANLLILFSVQCAWLSQPIGTLSTLVQAQRLPRISQGARTPRQSLLNRKSSSHTGGPERCGGKKNMWVYYERLLTCIKKIRS